MRPSRALQSALSADHANTVCDWLVVGCWWLVVTYEFEQSANLVDHLSLSPAEQIQVYRIVQEVLSNIARHSTATRVLMNVTAPANGAFRLTIEDDGDGFTPNSVVAQTGRGLTNIKSRASLIGAETTQKKTDKGTTFELRLKCTANSGET